MFTPEHILLRSLCRRPHCAGPSELRDKTLDEWPIAARAVWQRQAKSEIECLAFASEYAEPGYDKPKRGILFANWNYFAREAGDLLERAGYSVEWSDEWTTCDFCGKALRVSPDSYMWQPYFVETEDGQHCMNCLDEDDIEQFENNPRRAVNVTGIDLKKFGYVEIQCDYESGLYGTHDNPQSIYDALVGQGYDHIVFQVSDVEQFRIKFCVWYKTEETTAAGI